MVNFNFITDNPELWFSSYTDFFLQNTFSLNTLILKTVSPATEMTAIIL